MAYFDKRNIQYYRDYASLKARGVGSDEDKVYTLTVHKCNVRIPGYEYYSDFELEKRRLMRLDKKLNQKSDDNTAHERFANSIVRSRSNIVQLGANNPWEYFVTFTFRREFAEVDAYDLDAVKKKLLKFFADYSQRSGAGHGFKYLLIPEKHDDGAWHFHGLLMGINPKDLVVNENGYLDFIPYRKRFGFVSFGRNKNDNDKALGDNLTAGRIRDLRKTASYITKYITKDMFGSDGRTSNEHLYFASKGLKKDETLAIGESLYEIDAFVDAGYEVHQNEFCAKIEVEKDLGLASIDTWFITAGEKDRFNLPAMPLKLSKKQKNDLRCRRFIEMDNRVDLYARYPVRSVSSVSDREAKQLDALFERSAWRSGKYEQLKINEMGAG